jgi:hypothetical protein
VNNDKHTLFLVPNTDFQRIQQVTKAYEILANIAEQNKNQLDTNDHLLKAKENQKKLLNRLQANETSVLRENQTLYCK